MSNKRDRACRARSQLLAVMMCFSIVFGLTAAGGLIEARQPVYAQGEPEIGDEQSHATGMDGALTSFGLSAAALPLLRVAPSSLIFLDKRGQALPNAITVIEMQGKQGILDVTLVASDLINASGDIFPGSGISFEPNGFDLAAGESRVITVTISLDPDLPRGFFSGEISVESANAGTESLAFNLDTRFRALLPVMLDHDVLGAGPNSQPPSPPTYPFPADGAAHQSARVNVGWSIADDNSHDVTYDVFLETGDSTPDVAVCEGVTSSYCDLSTLNYGTRYYWQVVARDSSGLTTAGPVWHFVTGNLPDTPSKPSPSDGTNTDDPDVTLSWTGSDPDGDSVTYDVFLDAGNEEPDVLVCDDVTSTSCDPGTLSYGMHYYWQVVATDSHGLATTGPVWDFTANRPPDVPSNPSPVDGTITQDSNIDLSWTGSDPDGDSVTYDVFLDAGNEEPGVLVCDDVTSTSCDPGTLSYGMHYYWRVVATDSHGLATTGPVWDFTANRPPDVPSNPSPVDGTITQDSNIDLSWTGGDADDGDSVSYDVYFAANDSTPDVLVSDDQSATIYDPGILDAGFSYYWRIVATDSHGVSTAGATWQFTVVSGPPESGCWYTRANMPTARRAPAAVELDGKIYVIGGQDEYGDEFYDVVERYDPLNDIWETITPMNTPRAWLVAEAVNGKIYAIGGVNLSGKLNVVEEYDPASNAWTYKYPMPTGRDDAAAAVVDGKIYVMGGWLNGQAISAVEFYEPMSNSWTITTSMPISLAMTSAAAVGGKIHVMGGYDGIVASPAHLVYDPVGDAWSYETSLTPDRDRLAAVELDGKIYVIGGRSNTLGWTGLAQQYDPNTDLWADMNPMPTPRGDLAAALAGEQVYVFGGRSDFDGPVLNVTESVDFACMTGP